MTELQRATIEQLEERLREIDHVAGTPLTAGARRALDERRRLIVLELDHRRFDTRGDRP